MGFWNSLKNAVNAVTGGGATVTIEYPTNVVFAGDTMAVHVTVTSTGGSIKSDGVFVDLESEEQIHLKKGDGLNVEQPITINKVRVNKKIPISGALTLQPNETLNFEGNVTIPADGQPAYDGLMCEHVWKIRGRLEATGNDPDSGWKPLNVSIH